MVRHSRWLHFGLPAVAGVSLVTAVLADVLFYKQHVGWTLGGFVAWLLLIVLLRNGRAVLIGPQKAWGWSLVLMTIGLCVSLVLEPGTIAVVLSLITLGTLAMLAHGWSDRRLGWRWLSRLVGAWGGALIRPVRDSRLARRWARRTNGLRKKAMAAARLVWGIVGIVIPVALSLIFLGLFSLANPVVSDWMGRGVDRVGDFLTNLTDYITFSRMLLWYLAGFVCWGLLRHRPRRTSRIVRLGRNLVSQMAGHTDQADAEAQPISNAAAQKRDAQGDPWEESEAEPSIDPNDQPPSEDMLAWLARQYQSLIVRCLVAMNLVFALQLVLDSRYLVLGESLPKGMTYAEYAHRGAYPLIVTAILAAALVLAVFRPGGIAQRSRLAVWLVLIWIVQNILLVISAAWRLGAYVEVFTLTRLRIAAAIWMLMVAGCLALLLWRIARSRDNAWLTGWAMGWGIAVLWVCSFVPFDPMIAHYNVHNCKELGGQAGSIDIAYLEELGADALPAIEHLLEHLPPKYADAPPGHTIYGWYEESRFQRVEYDTLDEKPHADDSLRKHLQHIQAGLSAELADQLDGWRGWTARRAWLRQSTGE